MGPGTINQVLDAIAAQVHGAIAALVPVGQALTGSFVVLSILMLGAALVAGQGALVAPIVRVTAASAGTFWCIGIWPDIAAGTLRAARAAIGLMTGGYDGPATLFQMANDVSARVFTETHALSLWSFSTYVEAVVDGIAGVLIWLGLSITGLLAVLAEFQLIIGAAAAPLILPALAFGFTTPIGWGPVTFMVSAGVRVVVMGTVSFVMSHAVTAVIAVPGTDVPLTSDQMWALMGVALLTALVGLCCNGIARDLVTGSPGSLGWGSATRTAGVVTSVAGIGGAVAGGGVRAVAAGARLTGAGAQLGANAMRARLPQGSGGGGPSSGGGGGGSGKAPATQLSSGTGSPFR